MISILDYGSGNIDAFVNICKENSISYKVINDWKEVETSEKLIFPGVGAFDPTITKLNESGLLDSIKNLAINKQRPILGVCVGMQCLMDASDEGELKGLSLINGKCSKFDTSRISLKPKIPHMGWNSVSECNQNILLRNVDLNRGFYFLHSYHADNIKKEDVVATCFHGYEFPCIIQHDHTFGVQFHPEKSHSNGTMLMNNFNRL
jgi:glutamine amidotransferase